MIVDTSQEQIVINPDASGYPKNNIGIKLSGGADSSILCYMLYKHAVEHNKTLVPMTVIHGLKPTNLIYARKVYWWMVKHFGVNVWHKEHFTSHSHGPDYTTVSENLEDRLFANGTVDIMYSGITANPPREVWLKFKGVGDGGTDTDLSVPGGLPDSRDRTDKPKQTVFGNKVFPFKNIDKKGIAELYDHFNVTDTLFPITRTCEDYSNDPEEVPHCGECVWCQERLWGFGKL